MDNYTGMDFWKYGITNFDEIDKDLTLVIEEEHLNRSRAYIFEYENKLVWICIFGNIIFSGGITKILIFSK